jgi:UDP-N-acetylglucosamine acyltransferase
MNIHPTAIIDKSVELGKNVTVGPFSIIKGRVRIGDNTKIESHAVVGSDYGIVEIGENNVVGVGAAVGGPPQDLKYNNEITKLVIGDGNTFREYVTLNCGTPTGGGVTKIGSKCLLMAYVHIAHDCKIGDDVVIANACQFGGHVEVGDHAKIGGVCVFNQFIRIGQYCFVAGDSSANKDLIPFSIAQGRYATARAANSIGLERAGFAAGDIDSIYKSIRFLTKGDRTIEEAVAEIRANVKSNKYVEELITFVTTSERGIAR